MGAAAAVPTGMHPHKRKQLVLSAIALSLVVAIVAWNWDSTSGHPGPLTLYRGENGDDADWHGTLVREGNCLYVDSEVQGTVARVLLALPNRGTRWDEGAQAIRAGGVRLGIGNFGVRFGGASLRVGDEVSIGGSSIDSATYPGDIRDRDWAVPPDPSCDLTHVWFADRP